MRNLLRLALVVAVLLAGACQSRRELKTAEFHVIGPLLVLSPRSWIEDQMVHAEWTLKANANCGFTVSYEDRSFQTIVATPYLIGFNESQFVVDRPSDIQLVTVICDQVA